MLHTHQSHGRGTLCPAVTYTDKWGESWVRRDDDTLIRLSDGNIGNFYKGQGLTTHLQ